MTVSTLASGSSLHSVDYESVCVVRVFRLYWDQVLNLLDSLEYISSLPKFFTVVHGSYYL